MSPGATPRTIAGSSPSWAIAGAAGVSVQTFYAAVGSRAEVLRVLLAAGVAGEDPTLAADLARQHRDRWTDQRAVVGLLHGELREGLTPDDAADVVLGHVSHEVWDLFCLDRGWSPDRLARLTADTLTAALLAPAAPPRPR